MFLEVKDMACVVEAINGKLNHRILIPGEHLRIAWKTWHVVFWNMTTLGLPNSRSSQSGVILNDMPTLSAVVLKAGLLEGRIIGA